MTDSGVIRRLHDNDIQSAWARFLELQTTFFGPGEVQWLQHHQALRGDVLEIGSALGHYGSYLAGQCAAHQVVGLEASADLIARQSSLPGNYRIEQCRVGAQPLPERHRGRFDTCVVRYVLQHDPAPLRLLQTLHDALPVGSRIFLVEEDDRLFVSNGRYAPWDAAVAIWKRACRFGGTNSQIGMDLPILVERAGFAVEDFSIDLRSNIDNPVMFFDFFKSVVELLWLSTPEFVSDEEFAFVSMGLEQAPPLGLCAVYPQIRLVARKR
ncbi:class I SAM-dependent methyltransferase [Pseudomonas shirazensis]|uniref:class I SAM-dependent methyltransferase n=1 Tax=Pseudomonas shirazensis TaxID=2745494 RepID=UPI003D2BDCA0